MLFRSARKHDSKDNLAAVLTSLPLSRIETFNPDTPVMLLGKMPASEYLSGVGADSLGSAIAVMKKFKDWAAVRATTTLLKKVEAVCPDILFDLEQKLSFTAKIVSYSASFVDWADKAIQGVRDAQATGDEERIKDALINLFSGFAVYIGEIGRRYHDHQSYFGRATYDRFRENLNTLANDDRRAIHAFYAHYDVAISTMDRVFNREIPSVTREGDIPLIHVQGWVGTLIGAVDELFTSAIDLLKR